MIIDLLSIVVDEEESQSLEKIQKELKAMTEGMNWTEEE